MPSRMTSRRVRRQTDPDLRAMMTNEMYTLDDLKTLGADEQAAQQWGKLDTAAAATGTATHPQAPGLLTVLHKPKPSIISTSIIIDGCETPSSSRAPDSEPMNGAQETPGDLPSDGASLHSSCTPTSGPDPKEALQQTAMSTAVEAHVGAAPAVVHGSAGLKSRTSVSGSPYASVPPALKKVHKPYLLECFLAACYACMSVFAGMAGHWVLLGYAAAMASGLLFVAFYDCITAAIVWLQPSRHAGNKTVS